MNRGGEMVVSASLNHRKLASLKHRLTLPFDDDHSASAAFDSWLGIPLLYQIYILFIIYLLLTFSFLALRLNYGKQGR
jgi:hypothetical protein